MESNLLSGAKPLDGVDSSEHGKTPRFSARVTVRAIEQQTNDATNASQEVLARIRKMLDRTCCGRGCPEEEMRTAAHKANQMMQRYNVTQAQVYRSAAANEVDRAKFAGQSIVRITATKLGAKVCNSAWAGKLAAAMAKLHDCKCFSSAYKDRNKLHWTFYGIAANTVAAAETFEAVHNIVLDWASRIMRGNKNSYCLGFADGTSNIVEAEKAADIKRANDAQREAEAAMFTKRKPGTSFPRSKGGTKIYGHTSNLGATIASDAASESDTENDSEAEDDLESEDDVEADIEVEDEDGMAFEAMDLDIPVEDEIKSFINAKKPSSTTDDFDNAGTALTWRSSSDLMLYRSDAQDIAQKYLETLGIKLTNGRRRPNIIRHRKNYRQGRKDSAKIDYKRNKLA